MAAWLRALVLWAAAVPAASAPTPLPPPPLSPAAQAPPAPPAPLGWPTVGVWNGSLPSLPQTSGGNLPHSPMLGNGYMGVQLATARATAPIVNGSRGPATPGNDSLHLYVGSNAMWGIYPATKPALGPTGKGTRRAVGGVSLTGLEALLGAGAAFSAEQRIMEGELKTRSSSSAGAFTTTTKMDPRANVLTLACSWAPGAAQSAAAGPANLTLAAWALTTYPGHPPGQRPGDPDQGPAVVPAIASVLDGATLVVTREAVPTSITSPRRIKVALAVAVQSAALAGASSSQAAGADPVSAATGQLSIDPAHPSSFTVVVAMVRHTHTPSLRPYALTACTHPMAVPRQADNLHTPDASTTALGAAAAKLAHAAAPSTLSASASEWWAAFWARSFVHLPTEPAIEALWNGAQYILACSASPDVDPATPAPGLGGPFVTSDNSGWNGDYTLDCERQCFLL